MMWCEKTWTSAFVFRATREGPEGVMKENTDTEDVLRGLEADRSAGTLEKLVSRSEVRYGVDPDDPERLVSIDKEGRTQQLHKSGLSRFKGGAMDDYEKAKLDNFLSPTDFIGSLPCS